MSRATPELSLIAHKAKFFKVTEDERRMHEEQKKILALHINDEYLFSIFRIKWHFN